MSKKNPKDKIESQYRFWLLIPEHAPEVMKNLFETDRAKDGWPTWTRDQWDARWMHICVVTPNPVALAWRDRWGLPDWCLTRAEHVLSDWQTIRAKTVVPKKEDGRVLFIQTVIDEEVDRRAWRKDIENSPYYFTPEFTLTLKPWTEGEVFTFPTKEQLRKRVKDAFKRAVDQAVDKYDKEFIQPMRDGEKSWLFPFPESANNRKFELHAKWLIARKLQKKKLREIAEAEPQPGSSPH